MDSEAKKIISFIFKRSGKKQLKNSEFYLTLSVDLKWFPPNDSKDFIVFAVKNNLLKESNNLLSPNFEINDISIPFGYYPNKKSFKINITNKTINITDIQELIFKKYHYNVNEQNEIKKIILNISTEKNIYQNVAALVVFMGLNIKISEYIKFTESQIISD